MIKEAVREKTLTIEMSVATDVECMLYLYLMLRCVESLGPPLVRFIVLPNILELRVEFAQSHTSKVGVEAPEVDSMRMPRVDSTMRLLRGGRHERTIGHSPHSPIQGARA